LTGVSNQTTFVAGPIARPTSARSAYETKRTETPNRARHSVSTWCVPPYTAALDTTFDRIPQAHFPPHPARPRRLDFGADAELRVLGQAPPREGPRFGSLVSAVDDDGNEIAGIAVPEVRVPLATHTGWTLRHPDTGGAEQLLVFAGATLPFPATRQAREASGDPRPSIEERYASRQAYLERVRGAALDLVSARYLLEEDVELSITLAGRMWDWLASRER
jgi:hypothetical protein